MGVSADILSGCFSHQFTHPPASTKLNAIQSHLIPLPAICKFAGSHPKISEVTHLLLSFVNVLFPVTITVFTYKNLSDLWSFFKFIAQNSIFCSFYFPSSGKLYLVLVRLFHFCHIPSLRQTSLLLPPHNSKV